MKKLALSDEILLTVQQPARYIGGELNLVMKNPSLVDIRFAMCFPDVYDIGMSTADGSFMTQFTSPPMYLAGC